jgi:alpha-tubulin suppressor-like RCC1 family protein
VYSFIAAHTGSFAVSSFRQGFLRPRLVLLTLMGMVASIAFSATLVPLAASASAAPALTATTASVTAAATSAPGTGTVAAWGRNFQGGLGNGTTTQSSVPVTVSGLSGVTAIAGGYDLGYALRSDGTVWAWGKNRYGELGNGTGTDSSVPVPVSGLTRVTAIASGYLHGYALRSNGTVWEWGSNGSTVPVLVKGLSGVTAIAGGYYAGYALRSDGTVWAWGTDNYGALGTGTETLCCAPAQVSGLTGVTAIASMGLSAYALRSDGTVWAWGFNDTGGLGNGTTTHSNVPVQVSGLTGVTAIASGFTTGYALREDGTVRAWGSNSQGDLGDGTTTSSSVPVQVSGLSGVTAIAGGGTDSGGVNSGYALRSDGTVWAWGVNWYGQLGDGSTTSSSVPVHVSGLTGVTAIAGGHVSAYALVGGVAPEVAPGVDPYPLLGAHGITGQASDMTFATELAAATVPGLPRPVDVPTEAIGGVYTNGAFLVGAARELIANTGADKVNVIAHSKGGLDARYAMWTNPELFNSLGMLATPNAGSAWADTVCKQRRIPLAGNFLSGGMGPCDNDSQALFNLQPGWVVDVFNKQVRDHPQHQMVVAAGDCTGFKKYKCNGGANFFFTANCGDGSDSVVCVESAFALTTLYGGGSHEALLPTFDAEHTPMREQRCPVTRVLGEMYPLDSVGNPWLDSGTCVEPPAAAAVSATNTGVATADGATNTGLFGGRPTADQAAVVAGGGPTAPAVFTLNPEGGDVAAVNVNLPVGVTAEVKVTDTDGTVDATATVTATETFGEPGYLVQLTGLAGANRVVTVTPSADSRTEFSSTVLAGTVSPTAAVEMDADGQGATIRVTATGLTLQSSSTATVEAAWLDGDQRKTMPLVFDATSGQFSARFTPPTGTYVPVDVTFNADGKTRVLTAGVVIPDGSGTIGALEPSALVDTNADGTPDVFRIPINTTVSKAGNYQIAADLSRDGKIVMSVPGTAQLQPGSGQILLDVPVGELLRAGQDGPFQVTSVLLTEGSATRRTVAQSALVGTTGPLNLAALTTAKVVLSTPAATSEDTNHDGLLDLLRFSAGVAVPKTADYLVTATLLAPTGQAVSVHQSTVSLTAGRTSVNLDFNGKLIGANGDGMYSLTGLTISEVSNPANISRIEKVLTPSLDSTLWTPATVPGSPTSVAAVAGIDQATLSWTAPVDNGGTAVSGYTVTASPGGKTATTTGATAATVTGLTNGTAYTFTVTATNALGTSPASAASAPVTPPAPPGAPVIGTATPGNASALVRWTAPDNGGSAITGSSVRVVTAAAPTVQVGALRPLAGAGTSLNVTGLTNGTAYRFQVQSTNAVGTGAFSGLSVAVTPATAPATPVIGLATPFNLSALVRWTAPANGGSAITGYSVRVVNAAGTQIGTLRAAAATATNLTVTGLTNGVGYRFQVQATNPVATGAFSSLSTQVIPIAVPNAPVIAPANPGALGGVITATANWAPPVDGPAVTGYVVTAMQGTVVRQTSPVQAATARSLSMTMPAGNYTFVVQARNALGLGAFSAPSELVTAQ